MEELLQISVLIPSRGRPDKLARCLRSLGIHPGVEILIATDEDDTSDYAAVTEGYAKHYVGPRPKTLATCINDLAAKAAGRLLFFLGDDYVIETSDWPQRII